MQNKNTLAMMFKMVNNKYLYFNNKKTKTDF